MTTLEKLEKKKTEVEALLARATQQHAQLTQNVQLLTIDIHRINGALGCLNEQIAELKEPESPNIGALGTEITKAAKALAVSHRKERRAARKLRAAS